MGSDLNATESERKRFQERIQVTVAFFNLPTRLLDE